MAFALLAGSASAQNPLTPGVHLQKEEKKLTPEEQERQKQLDTDYKAATNKIPDQKKANDPWASVRPTPTVPPSKKKQQ